MIAFVSLELSSTKLMWINVSLSVVVIGPQYHLQE